MKFAKNLILALTCAVALAGPATAADATCDQAVALRIDAHEALTAEYAQAVANGDGASAAAFLNGDLLAVAPASVAASKAELDRLDHLLAAQGCASDSAWKADWTRLL